MTRPLVSIVIPSFNQGKYIRETIDSILVQDYRPIEILVLDGASKDETIDVLRSYGANPTLRWWSEPDHGVVDAVNKGLALASGTYLAIQSSDDTYLPGAISIAVEALEDDPSLGLVYGDVEYIDESSKKFGGTSLPEFNLGAYVGKASYIPQPAAFFTRKAADAVGPWRQEISYAADAEFYLRIAMNASVRKLDAVVARYRYHRQQRDTSGAKIMRDWEIAIREWMDREHPEAALRRRALAGIHLVRFHYAGESQWFRKTVETYFALAADPSLLSRPEFPRRYLIPGRDPIWSVLSRIKRALGFAPRRGPSAL